MRIERVGVSSAFVLCVTSRNDPRPERIVVNELPYQVNKAKLMEKLPNWSAKSVEGISDLRDESDRHG